jgi:hypothetical protein
VFPEHKLYLCSFCKGWLLLLSEKFDDFMLRFLLLEARTHLERYAVHPCIAALSLNSVILACTCRIQAEEEHRKELAPWPTTKNRSMHDRMTPPRKLNSSIMN